MEHVSGPSPASHKNQIAVVIGVTIFSLTVATIAVAVRTYTRKWIVDRMGIDDYFAIVALVSMTYVATAVMAPDTNQRAQAIAYGCGTSILCSMSAQRPSKGKGFHYRDTNTQSTHSDRIWAGDAHIGNRPKPPIPLSQGTIIPTFFTF